MLLSLVIPCYNEEENVQRFFDEINNAFLGKIDNYELVFVDDGSKDATYKKLKGLYENNPNSNIQVLSFSRNFGKESAIYAGLSKAKGDLVCIIDADLQQRPEVVLKMLDEINCDDSLDCVAAYQENRQEGRLISASKSAFYRLINKVADVDFVNGASDFRLMRRNMVDALLQMTEYHRFSKGLFSWVGFNTKYIPYTAQLRENGESKWGFRKLIKYGLDGIFAFSVAPLKIATGIGILSAIASVIYLFVIIIQKIFFGIDVPGYATIVVLILFMGGMQLFGLGILGEYISKMYIQVKDRPIYILKANLCDEDEEI